MSQIIGNVVCQELVAGSREGNGARGAQATKRWLCDWADRFKLADALMGEGVGQTLAGMDLTAPVQHPHIVAPCLANQVWIGGVDSPRKGADGYLEWNYAIVEVDYAAPVFGTPAYPYPEFSPDPTQPILYAEINLDIESQELTLRDSVYWQEGIGLAGKTLSSTYHSVHIPIVHVGLTFHRTRFLPLAASVTAAKAPLNVNDPWWGLPRGHWLFKGVRTHTAVYSDGLAKDCTLALVGRPIASWNKATEDGRNWYLVGDKDGNDLMDYYDFNNLIFPTYRTGW